MTREKALEVMDKLVPMGYTVTLGERDLGKHGHVFVGSEGEMTSISRWVDVSALSFDKIDLRALVNAADELGLDVGTNKLNEGNMTFFVQLSEDEQRQREVISGRRPHPRDPR